MTRLFLQNAYKLALFMICPVPYYKMQQFTNYLFHYSQTFCVDSYRGSLLIIMYIGIIRYSFCYV